jgi:hypothetical protein
MEYDILSLDEIEPGMMINFNPVKGKDSLFLMVVEIDNVTGWSCGDLRYITAVMEDGTLTKKGFYLLDFLKGEKIKYRVIKNANE